MQWTNAKQINDYETSGNRMGYSAITRALKALEFLFALLLDG
jgi:ribonuclease HI